ncbi:MAG: YbjN domain-containing protein, partial [Proteobacteria bacterium]|nr:YbjN domain-containing protein [Pseudomonadota bacterium]
MPVVSLESAPHPANPIDVIEEIVSSNDWDFDRAGDNELAVEVAGQWCNYRLYFSWRDDYHALHFSCAFDMRVPESRLAPVHQLLALVNEKMWIGHFDLWSDDGLPMFRHAVLLRGS